MLNNKIVSLCVMTNLKGVILQEHNWEVSKHECSHLYILPSNKDYIEALSYADEVNIHIRKETEYDGGEIRLSWLEEQDEYSVKDIVMTLLKKLEANCKWEIRKLHPTCDKIVRYKLNKIMSMEYCKKDHVREIHEKAIKIARESEEVGHLMQGCSAIFHHYSIAVLGMDRLEATGFGFTSKDNTYYSVKYKQDELNELYFSDLYIIDDKLYSSIEICPFTMVEKCVYDLNKGNCIKSLPNGKKISTTFSGSNLASDVGEFISIQGFPSSHEIMYFGNKPHGTTIEFKVSGLSRNHYFHGSRTL